MSQGPTNNKPGQRPYYDRDVDFDDLAARDQEWAAICKAAKKARWINFQDPTVIVQLTRSLLKADFGISSLTLPDNRLCPPVPVRWNYVRWIQELLDTTSESYAERYNPERQIIGLDIGVGASAIYPLLACSSRSGWRMFATDVDSHSFQYATTNIDANGLDKRVRLRLSTADEPLIPLDRLGGGEDATLDFVMTNPPFYTSEQDLQDSYHGKDASPSAVCTGSSNEMIYPGGDVGFVTCMLHESLILQDRVQWYTAMLGKLASLQQLIAKFEEHGITNFATTCLRAGHKTRRWAVAWSFRDLRPSNSVARHGELVHAVLPVATERTIHVPLMSADWAGEKVDGILQALDVLWQWRKQLRQGMMACKENVWSRAARRRRKFGQTVADSKDEGMADEEETDEPVALAVKITCLDEEVRVRWLRGMDHVVFTSFCGMLKGALTNHGQHHQESD